MNLPTLTPLIVSYVMKNMQNMLLMSSYVMETMQNMTCKFRVKLMVKTCKYAWYIAGTTPSLSKVLY